MAEKNNDVVLSVKDLHVYFYTNQRCNKVLRGVSFDIKRGRTLCVVGESGCGKSVTANSILRLLPELSRIEEGSITYYKENGEEIRLDQLQKNGKQMRKLRGEDIAIIFQDPMTALNPVYTVGHQIEEMLKEHKKGMTKAQYKAAAIEDLADLPGRKYQKKRNHVNRFRMLYHNWRVVPLSKHNLPAVKAMAEHWYRTREASDPMGNYVLEKVALARAFDHYEELGFDGLALMDGDRVLAFSIASRLSEDTMDIHFEKALEDVDGAYPAINQAFASYLRDKYPALRYLDREEDMGLEGLRKSKLSYYPDHLVEKCWARLWEESDED